MAINYKIVAKPNNSISARGMKFVVAIVAFISFAIGLSFSLMGAWLILPFAGLEVIAIAYAFYYVNCRSGDYESISIEGDDIEIEKKNYKKISHTVFNRYWARVILRDLPCGDQSLWLKSHGKEVELGRHLMNNDQRLALAKQIRQRIGDVF